MFDFLRGKKKKKQERASVKPAAKRNDILDYVEFHGVVNKDACTPYDSEQKKECDSHIPPGKTEGQSEKKDQSVSGGSEAFWHTKDLTPEQKFILEYTEEQGFFGAQKEEFFTEHHSSETKTDVPTGRERRIDLHGCTLNDARLIVRTALDDAPSQGVKQLLIIHGKGFDGRGVLKEEIRRLLRVEWRMRIKSFEYASLKDGGSGATRVYLH